jgi:hypothetical protein
VGSTSYSRTPSSVFIEHFGFPGRAKYIPCNLKNSSVRRELLEYNTGVPLSFDVLYLLRHAFNAVVEHLFDSIWTGVGCLSVEDTLEYYRSYGTAAGPAFGCSKRGALEDSDFIQRWVDDVSNLHYSVRTVSGACAKDELLDRIKIETRDKQRAFISVSLYTILWQYLLFCNQNDAAKRLWSSGSSFAYGFAKQYQGWDCVLRKFRGSTVYSMDFKRCDKTMPNILFCWFYRYRISRLEETYGYSFGHLADSLAWDLTRSLVVMPDGDLFVKHRGNPSGQVNTTFDTIVVLHVLRVAAEMQTGTPLWESPALHYGDDTLMTACVDEFSRLCSSIGCTVESVYTGPIVGSEFISHRIAEVKLGYLVGLGNIHKSIDRLRFSGGYSDPTLCELILGLYEEQFPWYGTSQWTELMDAIKWVCDRRCLEVEFPSHLSLSKLFFGTPGFESSRDRALKNLHESKRFVSCGVGSL